MPRLRRSDLSTPGFTRRRRGRGFSYADIDGSPLHDADTLERIRALAIPPAWKDVWISPWPGGHIQAVGTDAAGRRQYRYHDAWRLRRDRLKHERVLELAQRLPAVRETVTEHLAGQGLSRERVLAAAVRLLDLGFFRVGGEEYAEENGTYGLATLRRDHVELTRGGITFDYEAKGRQHRVHAVVDPDVRKVVQALLRRRDPGPELLAYHVGREWRDVRSVDINAYLREVAGEDMTAKDFRTWHATVLCTVALARARATSSPSGRKRAVAGAVRGVAEALGNTPAVCRKSYIDPRIIDLYDDGSLAAVSLTTPADMSLEQLAARPDVERVVIELLSPG
ncbi:MAG: DNA topoisomerase IB [Geodermatophilaceae bacterium]|nr:DNA topoisomerase IB [Geodermatophilaceae bacterium]